jgi:hypothetical protein
MQPIPQGHEKVGQRDVRAETKEAAVLQPETVAILVNQPVICIVVRRSLSETGEKDVIGSPKVSFGRAGACQNGGLIACNAEAQPFAIKRGLRALYREAVAQPSPGSR